MLLYLFICLLLRSFCFLKQKKKKIKTPRQRRRIRRELEKIEFMLKQKTCTLFYGYVCGWASIAMTHTVCACNKYVLPCFYFSTRHNVRKMMSLNSIQPFIHVLCVFFFPSAVGCGGERDHAEVEKKSFLWWYTKKFTHKAHDVNAKTIAFECINASNESTKKSIKPVEFIHVDWKGLADQSFNIHVKRFAVSWADISMWMDKVCRTPITNVIWLMRRILLSRC